MGEYKNQAVELLQETAKKFGRLADKMITNIETEGSDNANLAYQIATELDVKASQLAGEVKTVEGMCNVDNKCAKVTICGVSLRGNIQFEVELGGEWCKGHRENSQYGQIFVTNATKGSHIFDGNEKGRVTFPLTMD